MDKGTIKVISFLLTIGVAFGAYMLKPKWHSRQVRKAAYERYSEFGQPELVREMVDQYHDEIFEQCYESGAGQSKTKFDADKYGRLMDRKMEGLVDSMLTKAVAEAVNQKPAAPVAAPPPPSAMPSEPAVATPVAAEEPADPEASRYEILNLAAKHIQYGTGGHEFFVEVDVTSWVRMRPDAIRLSVQCPGGGRLTQDSPAEAPRRLDQSVPSGVRRATFRVVVPDKVMGASGGICELEASARNASGGYGAERKLFIVAR